MDFLFFKSVQLNFTIGQKLKFENNDNELSETECNNLLHVAYYNNDWSKILKLQELIKQNILI